MIYILSGVLCVALAIAIYNTMLFMVDVANSIIEGVNTGEGYIDNKHFILSWALVVICFFVKSVLT